MQEAILKALRRLESQGIVKNRDEFSEQMKAAFKEAKIAIPTPLFKTILIALAERDETADICTDSKGNPNLTRIYGTMRMYHSRRTSTNT